MAQKHLNQEFTVLNGVQATGAGNKFNSASWDNVLLTLSTAGIGTGDSIIMKIQGSYSETPPDFDAAQSATNRWDYILITDLENEIPVDGDDGVTFLTADDVRQFEIVTNGLKWITVNVTTISDTTNTKAYTHLQAFKN